jgi:hypothetical protein
MIKIISGYTDKGGSTTAFINLTNYLNSCGIETMFYGPHNYHLDKCKSGLIHELTVNPDDRLITHFLNLPERPEAKKVVLSCHEKWWYQVGKVKQFWDTAVFLHQQHREYHSDYLGDSVIIPNIKEPLIAKDKEDLDLVAGIIGTIEDRKQTHISIQRAIKDRCRKIYLFGHIGDQKYFEENVKPLLNPRIEMVGHTTDKQAMYDMIGRVYHSSKGEVACLVKDECYLTNTKFFGNEETENEISTLTNDEIIELWKKVLEL